MDRVCGEPVVALGRANGTVDELTIAVATGFQGGTALPETQLARHSCSWSTCVVVFSIHWSQRDLPNAWLNTRTANPAVAVRPDVFIWVGKQIWLADSTRDVRSCTA